MGTVSTAQGSAPLRREPKRAMAGGVCSGIAERYGIDILIPRAVFVATSVLGGAGIALYAVLWWGLPAGEGQRRFALPGGIKSVQVAAGIGLIVLALLLVLREWGLWFGDATVWPTVLVVSGAAMLWRQSQGRPPDPAVAVPGTAAGARERRAVPFTERLEAAAPGRAPPRAAAVGRGRLGFPRVKDRPPPGGRG